MTSALKPTEIDDASNLDASNNECQCCGRQLKNKFAWLELDQRDGTYHNFRDVPEDKSQGWFPFGLSCAKTELQKALAKREADNATIQPRP